MYKSINRHGTKNTSLGPRVDYCDNIV